MRMEDPLETRHSRMITPKTRATGIREIPYELYDMSTRQPLYDLSELPDISIC